MIVEVTKKKRERQKGKVDKRTEINAKKIQMIEDEKKARRQ